MEKQKNCPFDWILNIDIIDKIKNKLRLFKVDKLYGEHRNRNLTCSILI